jgi:hypothetical protein
MPREDYLGASVQIRREGDRPEDGPWASCPLFEGNLELAITWLRQNHQTLVQDYQQRGKRDATALDDPDAGDAGEC